MSLSAPRSPQPCAHTATLPRPTGWRLEVLEAPQDVTVRAGGQASFSCTLSETVPVGEATWYINGASVQPDDADWTVAADGSHHALLLRRAQPHHAGEVTFAAHDAVASARLTVLGGWLGPACRSSGPGSGGGGWGDEAFPLQKLLGAVCGPTRGVGSGHTLPVTPVHHCQPRRQTRLRAQLLTALGSRHQHGQVCGGRLPAAALTTSSLPHRPPRPPRGRRGGGAQQQLRDVVLGGPHERWRRGSPWLPGGDEGGSHGRVAAVPGSGARARVCGGWPGPWGDLPLPCGRSGPGGCWGARVPAPDGEAR